MAQGKYHGVTSATLLVHLIQLTFSYSFRNCIEDPRSNHTAFKCMNRPVPNISISDIVRDLRTSATHLNISHNKINHVPQGGFEHLPNLINLQLDVNQLSFIENDAFRGLDNLQTLNLSSNNITELFPNAFYNLSNLAELILSNNKLQSLPKNLFNGLTTLESVGLRKNRLDNFSDVVESVKMLTNLTKLDLSFNVLKTLQNSANLPLSLTNLYLSNNRLVTLNCGDVFLCNIHVLDLSYNRRLLSKHFNKLDLGQITYLRLCNTSVNLTELLNLSKHLNPAKVDFSGLKINNALLKNACTMLTKSHKTVDTMILQRNGLKSFNSLFACPNITDFLDLSFNKINDMNCLSFLKHHKRLLNITVEHNHLTELKTCQNNLMTANLTSLSYRYNRILKVNQLAFRSTPYLKTLKLNINIIAYMHPNALSGLKHLETLRLDNNLLSDLYEKSFVDLLRLKTLNLRNNQIAVIFNNTFQNLSQLRILDLGGNKISHFQKDSFAGLHNLSNLYLDRNRLKNTHINLFARLCDTLKVLDLQGNEIQYLSRKTTSPFKHLHKLEDLKLDSQQPYGITVVPHAFFHGLSTLKSLYLTNNHISGFASDTFDDLTSLEFLTLDNSCVGVQQLPAGIFKNLQKLVTLSAENMGIGSFSKDVFGNLTLLQKLQLNRNAMQTMDLSVLEDLPNLRYLDLRNTPLSCTCPNIDLQNWTNKNQNVQMVYLYSLTCPEDHRSTFHNFDTKVCYLDIGLYLFATTSSLTLLFSIIPLLYTKLYWHIKYGYYALRSWLGEQWRRLREQEKECKYDAFISYNSADEPWVLEKLLPNLEGDGFQLCLHHRDFEPGRYIVDNIVAAVYESRKTVCVISQNFLRSEWCSLEIQLASYRLFHELCDVLVLVFLEPIPERQISAYHRMRNVMLKKTYLQWPGCDSSNPDQAQGIFWNQLKRALRSGNLRSQEDDEMVEEHRKKNDGLERENFEHQPEKNHEHMLL
ncbi:toll-like receptor 21 [Denticeps clupeoides]|uniref:TIR domain-containing protein n=1 Tax=Denticeps clupeoides TaxID=299321 RepID=A0AAY4AEV5_9TELE|nr:toll-like receptor 13 [Denticeps clupeoides]